jgi:transcription termination factor NusB
MTELNNNVIVRFSYEKLTTLDEVNGSLKMIQEVFYYNSKNKTYARKLLRQISTKGQTYDEVIKELIRTKRNQASIDGGFENLKAN